MPSPAPEPTRGLRARWARLRRRGDEGIGVRTGLGRLASLVVFTLAALMATIGALSVQGNNPRSGRNSDLTELVKARALENKELTDRMAAQRAELDELSKISSNDPELTAELEKVAAQAGATPVKGPAVRVVLDDAPLSVKPPDVADDLLIVHQQDIQMVVNLFWAAGAEAMTVQGQRVISTTGIKCVGNSVVLHGVPYAPPYEITAIGDPDRLLAALAASEDVRIYQQYAEVYRLGWHQERVAEVSMPGFTGQAGLKYAKPPS
ncbi:DUF881 domain-containing protein [Propionibacteriaceae bacterium Y1923]|uniref:DUF881 domain-containing protein n=1 Tax=Aestuariimicrobium sp. Y1814 TaxID=3418742 RepID=UPI003C163DAB